MAICQLVICVILLNHMFFVLILTFVTNVEYGICSFKDTNVKL